MDPAETLGLSPKGPMIHKLRASLEANKFGGALMTAPGPWEQGRPQSLHCQGLGFKIDLCRASGDGAGGRLSACDHKQLCGLQEQELGWHQQSQHPGQEFSGGS